MITAIGPKLANNLDSVSNPCNPCNILHPITAPPLDTQILMTGHAWAQLRSFMHEAQYPVIEEIGLFELTKWPAPMWLYEVC